MILIMKFTSNLYYEIRTLQITWKIMIKPATFLTQKQIQQMLKEKKRLKDNISPTFKAFKSYSNLFRKQNQIQIVHSNSITPIPFSDHQKTPIKTKQQKKQIIFKRNHIQRHSIGERPKLFLERFLKQKMLLMKKISQQKLEFKQKLQKQKQQEATKIENLRKMIHQQKRLKKQLDKIKYASHHQNSIFTQNTTAQNIHLNQSVSFLSDKENKKYLPTSFTTTTHYDQVQIRNDKKIKNKQIFRQSIQEQLNNLNTQQNNNIQQTKQKASIYTNNNSQTLRQKKFLKVKLPGVDKFNNTEQIIPSKQSSENLYQRALYNTYSKKTSKFQSKTNFDDTTLNQINNISPLNIYTRRISKKLLLSYDHQEQSPKNLDAQIGKLNISQIQNEQINNTNSITINGGQEQRINLSESNVQNNLLNNKKIIKKHITNFYYKSPIFQILFKQKYRETNQSYQNVPKCIEKKLKFDENKEMKENRQIIKNHQTRNHQIKRVIQAFDYHLMLIDEKKYDISTKLDFNIQMLQIDQYNFDFIQTLDFNQKILFEFPEKQTKSKLKHGYTIYCENQKQNSRKILEGQQSGEANQKMDQPIAIQNWDNQNLIQYGLQQTSKCSSYYHITIKNKKQVKQVFINK